MTKQCYKEVCVYLTAPKQALPTGASNPVVAGYQITSQPLCNTTAGIKVEREIYVN